MLRGGGASQSEAIYTFTIRASDVLFAELVDVDSGYFGRNDDLTACSLAQRGDLRLFGAIPLLQTGIRHCKIRTR